VNQGGPTSQNVKQIGWVPVRATSTAHLAGPAGMPKGGDTSLHLEIPGPERGL